MIVNSHYPSLTKPLQTSYLELSSASPFRIFITYWFSYDGVLEYSTDKFFWNPVPANSQTSIYSNSEGKIYFRGTGNTYVGAVEHETPCWQYSGNDYVSAIGNIETLLDFRQVENGIHPVMSNYCFSSLFWGWDKLIQAPTLPAITLTEYCYLGMFFDCTSLTTAPVLPAMTLAKDCYVVMFEGCTSLTTVSSLPATTLAEACYSGMFYGCTSLTTAPAISATTLARNCCTNMFNGCTSLTTAPSLPVTTLFSQCYASMFEGCTSLTTIPELPATVLPSMCYMEMFKDCTNVHVSNSPSSQYQNLLMNYSSTTGSQATYRMLQGTGGPYTSDPAANVAYYTSNSVV